MDGAEHLTTHHHTTVTAGQTNRSGRKTLISWKKSTTLQRYFLLQPLPTVCLSNIWKSDIHSRNVMFFSWFSWYNYYVLLLPRGKTAVLNIVLIICYLPSFFYLLFGSIYVPYNIFFSEENAGRSIYLYVKLKYYNGTFSALMLFWAC